MLSAWQKVHSKLTVKSQTLIVILSLYFGFVLNFSFWRYVAQHLEITNFSVFVFAVSLLFFITVPLLWVFSLFVVPYVTKPVIGTFLLISSATNYLMFNLGVYIDTDMIRNVFETNVREARDLITWSGFVWVLVTGIIPFALLMVAKIEYRPFLKELKTRLIWVGLSLLVIGGFAASSYKEYASFGRNNRDVRKLLNTINYTYSTFRYFQRRFKKQQPFVHLDKDAKLTPYEDDYKTVLIFIVGETARAKNFSLDGYERNTNPLLSKQDIVYFKEVSSCGTATAVSVPCMFSNMTRAGFDADDAKNRENVLDLLQTGGYDVIWLENDDGCKGVCARVQYEDMVQTQHPKYCQKDYCWDEVLLDGLEERLKNITKDTVIVLHTMGSHGPTYYNRYPDEFKVFRPTCDTADIQNCTNEQIVNTYDNTILYTDYIISSAIDMLKKFPQFESGLIYVSDHGESLGENNVYLHGFPYKIAPAEQKEVPMIIWMSENMKREDHIDYDCLRREGHARQYTHDNLFHSLLGLMEVDSKTYDENMDLFHACRTKPLPFKK